MATGATADNKTVSEFPGVITTSLPSARHASPLRRVTDLVCSHDIGLAQTRTALQVMLCAAAGLVVGGLIGTAFGLPLVLGMTFGALPSFLCCLIITDEAAAVEARRGAVMLIPMIVGTALSVELHRFHVLELVLLVGALAFQLYSGKWGLVWHDIAAGLFATFLSGLILPLPPNVIPEMATITACAMGVTIGLRCVFLRPDARRSLRLARRGLLLRTGEVLDAARERMLAHPDATEKTTRSLDRAVDRAITRMQTAALQADALIGKNGSGAPGAIGQELHRIFFDLELGVEAIARTAPAVSRLQQGTRDAAVHAVARLRAEGTGSGRQIAAELVRTVQPEDEVDVPGTPDPQEQIRLVTHLARTIDWLASTHDRWEDLRSAIPEHTEVPFESAVQLTKKGQVKGAATMMEATLEQQGLSGPWRRWKVSPQARTTIQGVIALAIVEPIGSLISDQRFYWGVIGVMVVLAGTHTVHERVRKTWRRLWGTVAGGVVGLPLAWLVHGNGPATVVIVLLALGIGAYAISTRYPIWVTCLVTALCQLYAATGVLTATVVPLRLLENGLGAVVACIVSALILPVGTGAVLRTALGQVLGTVQDFLGTLTGNRPEPDRDGAADDEIDATGGTGERVADSAGEHVGTGVNEAADDGASSGEGADGAVPIEQVREDLRTRARAIDYEVHRMHDVFVPRYSSVTGGSDGRAQLVLARLDGLSLLAAQFAAQPALPEGTDTTALKEAAAQVEQSLTRVQAQLGPRDHGPAGTEDGERSKGAGAEEQEPETRTDPPASLARRTTLLGRMDDALAELETVLREPGPRSAGPLESPSAPIGR